ncbi:MAG: penicillin-binding transpeptidase domain-containing protein [Nocardioidaceae bacterium]
MRAGRKQRGYAVAVAATLLLSACTGSPDDPTETDDTAIPTTAGGEILQDFAAAWSESDKPDFKGVVDEPAIAATDIAAHVAELAITETRVALVDDLDCGDDSCRVHAKVTHQLAGADEWTYKTLVQANLNQGQWLVEWSPGTFHPDLTEVTTLVRNRASARRAPILDRNGKALTPERAIVRVGVVPEKVRRRTFDELGALVDVDVTSLRDRVDDAEPTWFVSVIDLRRADYDLVRTELLEVPGVSIDTAQRALAPTSAWGRAVLGVVGPATEDALANAGPYALPSDEVGLSGLQYTYQERLAGTPGISIALVEKAAQDSVINQVLTRPPEAGVPLETSLDVEVQDAAELAVSEATDTTVLVAVKASTGEILAAANAPGPTSYNTAFIGRYAPGSTFKVVSAAALLSSRTVTPATAVMCPDTTVVSGKRFKNYDAGIVPGRASFGDAFAASCNTTFVSLADDITGEQLAAAGELFGFDADWDLGIAGYSGSVPADEDLVTRAADMIGQGKVLGSPLMMAMVSAAVDSGVARTPTLLPDLLPGVRLDELDPTLVGQLQDLMRRVVTDGTGSSLDLRGLPVHAKTGTAEYQKGKGTGTNAWLIGYRGDIAFAVLVEKGKSGSDDAAPLVETFLGRLPARLYR